MERRMIQSDSPHWVVTLSPTDKDELLRQDRPRSIPHE